jgi:hypothetical protein
MIGASRQKYTLCSSSCLRVFVVQVFFAVSLL